MDGAVETRQRELYREQLWMSGAGRLRSATCALCAAARTSRTDCGPHRAIRRKADSSSHQKLTHRITRTWKIDAARLLEGWLARYRGCRTHGIARSPGIKAAAH